MSDEAGDSTAAATYATLATPAGHAGIATVLVAGERAASIVDAVFRPRSSAAPTRPGDVRLGVIGDGDEVLDEVLVARSPADGLSGSSTEFAIHGHGGRIAIERVLERVAREGAIVVAREEYVVRVGDTASRDAIEIDALASLPRAATPLAVSMLLAQASGALSRALAGIDDDLARMEREPDAVADALRSVHETLGALSQRARSGVALLDPPRVVLAGATNAGKSSLFNALVRTDRVITSEQRGTTRDTIEARLDVGGYPVVLVDTPGLDDFDDAVGRSGVDRARLAIDTADLVVLLFDGSRPVGDRDLRALEAIEGRRAIVVRTQADRPAAPPPADERFAAPDAVVSSETGSGLAALDTRILERVELDPDLPVDAGVPFLPEHARALDRAATAVATLRERLTTTGTLAATAPAAIRGILAEIRDRSEKAVKKLPTRGDRER